jgi:hypothetical protein
MVEQAVGFVDSDHRVSVANVDRYQHDATGTEGLEVSRQ